ncbi:MAG: zinc-ribbon domain containing protein [Candidatus Omnitrophica bacterium]|nr:zinc-ribbon domain containing protein [Candidatus Omnitrophota bacterium]
MKRKVSKNPIKKKREEKRIDKLKKAGRIVKGVEIPERALAANPDKQNCGAEYAVKLSYQDIQYICAGCGKEGVWSAEQQKKYFETQKGNIYNKPKWCYECRHKRIQDKHEEK